MDDPELAAQTLTRLRNLGVGISVDDFGTGYSSLSYLRRFPVTGVKIDRTFVESLGETRDDDAMVAGIVNLAHTLGLKVVAEGVEKPSQLQTLIDLGCDFAQGFLFSRPLPADILTAAADGGYGAACHRSGRCLTPLMKCDCSRCTGPSIASFGS